MRPRVLLAVARRPRLWGVAVVQAVRLAPRRWWARPPFLPLPDRAYLRFRMETQYGGDGTRAPEPGDLVTWLGWARDFDRITRRHHGSRHQGHVAPR